MLRRFLAKFAAPRNQLFAFPVKIERGSNSAMPEHLKGAYVWCYAAAPDAQTAMWRGVMKLKADGFIFEDVPDRKLLQFDPMKWCDYVAESWPEFPSHFPSQEEVIAGLPEGRI